MNNQNIEDKALTTLAFVIGLALIDNLSSTEQNAVGNWIMLIAQTLCTNGSYTFNKEWKSHINNGNTPVTKDTLEKVGDIIVNLDGADLIVSKDISKYIVDSFKELTRFSKSDIYEESIQKLNITEPKTEVLNIIIPSMRMDSIVSELIRTSRSKALEIINAERVFVNSEVITKNSKMLKENDMITVRGKGRFKIIKILNSTKKGNLVLEVEKYV